MNNFSTQEIMPYTPEKMFALIADIAKYKEFLPLCSDSIITIPEDNKGYLEAVLSIGYPKLRIKEDFLSQVWLDRQDLKIKTLSNRKPVKNIQTIWEFTPANAEGCLIKFTIQYAMRNMILQKIMDRAFSMAFHKVTDAFRSRAKHIYG